MTVHKMIETFIKSKSTGLEKPGKSLGGMENKKQQQ